MGLVTMIGVLGTGRSEFRTELCALAWDCGAVSQSQSGFPLFEPHLVPQLLLHQSGTIQVTVLAAMKRDTCDFGLLGRGLGILLGSVCIGC